MRDRTAEAGSLGRGRFICSLCYRWIMCDLQLDYSLTLQLWQAVFSMSPLYRLDLIAGDGLGVDTELVSHLNRKKAEEVLCQAWCCSPCLLSSSIDLCRTIQIKKRSVLYCFFSGNSANVTFIFSFQLFLSLVSYRNIASMSIVSGCLSNSCNYWVSWLISVKLKSQRHLLLVVFMKTGGKWPY